MEQTSCGSGKRIGCGAVGVAFLAAIALVAALTGTGEALAQTAEHTDKQIPLSPGDGISAIPERARILDPDRPRTVAADPSVQQRRRPPVSISRGIGEESERPAAKSQTAPLPRPGANSAAPQTPPPAKCRTLTIGDTTIPYRDVRGGTTPATGAGLWLGSDATTDGSWGYFIGHNPGSFTPVRTLKRGDTIMLVDSQGAARDYRVHTVFTIEITATWKAIAPRVTGFGESIVLQTCTGDGKTNTIVVAV